jgi:hypothetical protein
MFARAFVFQIDEDETNILSEISISEFSHSQDPMATWRARPRGTARDPVRSQVAAMDFH